MLNVLITVLFASALLSGNCIAANLTDNFIKLDTGQIVSTATDRFASWERVSIARSIEITEKTKLERAKLESKSSDPQIIIDSAEELEEYTKLVAIEKLADSNKIMGEVIVALTGGDKVQLDYIPMPKGAFSEFTDSLLGGTAKVANTPAAGMLAGGVALGNILKNIDQGMDVDSGGGDVSIVDEKTNSNLFGDGSGITNQPRQDNSLVNWAEEEG